MFQEYLFDHIVICMFDRLVVGCVSDDMLNDWMDGWLDVGYFYGWMDES